MGAAHLPSSNLVSRLLGASEFVVAVGALSAGGLFVIASAVVYASFAVFTFSALMKRVPLQSCGCFGREDTPPTAVHVVFNVASALALASLPILGHAPFDWSLPPMALALYVGFATIGVWASYLLLTRLPQLMILVRSR